MNTVRTFRRNSLFFWLLALTLGLRSLIAPGFMLETNGDGPLGLGIVLCEGLNGALPPAAGPSGSHSAHQHHDSGMPQDETASGMAGTTCALWSTSSTFVETLVFASDHLVPAGPDPFVAAAPAIYQSLYRQSPQQPRAPPVLS